MLTGRVQRSINVAWLLRKPVTKATPVADGELHRGCQSVPCMRRAQPISCKYAMSREITPKLLSSSDLLSTPPSWWRQTHARTHTNTRKHTLYLSHSLYCSSSGCKHTQQASLVLHVPVICRYMVYYYYVTVLH